MTTTAPTTEVFHVLVLRYETSDFAPDALLLEEELVTDDAAPFLALPHVSDVEHGTTAYACMDEGYITVYEYV